MPSKVQLYAQMADRTAEQITGSYQKWTAFLTTAARLYKYPYNEQLMIFAQRPEATACAEYDLWNKQIMLIPQMKLSRISASFHPPARAITIRNTEPNRFLLSSHELQIRVVSLRRIFRHIRHFVQSIPKSSSVSVSENGCFFMARMQNEPPAL